MANGSRLAGVLVPGPGYVEPGSSPMSELPADKPVINATVVHNYYQQSGTPLGEGAPMPFLLTNYIAEAMRASQYETLDDGSLFARIPECPGVWANEKTIGDCQQTLREVLEEWLVLRIQDKEPLPVIAGIDLSKKVAEENWDQ